MIKPKTKGIMGLIINFFQDEKLITYEKIKEKNNLNDYEIKYFIIVNRKN